MVNNNQINFSTVSLVLIGQIILSSTSVQAIQWNHTKLENDLFYLRNFNTSNIIDRVLSHNWTKNHECSTELNAIKKGLQNHEEWAIRGELYISLFHSENFPSSSFNACSVVDSWGNFPSGILQGNLYELGSFSECFHINRDGKPYNTQYCIGQGFLYKFNNALKLKKRMSYVGLGLCLPGKCNVMHLESVVNKVVHNDLRNMFIKIPKYECQREEYMTGWTPIDYVTM